MNKDNYNGGNGPSGSTTHSNGDNNQFHFNDITRGINQTQKQRSRRHRARQRMHSPVPALDMNDRNMADATYTFNPATVMIQIKSIYLCISV